MYYYVTGQHYHLLGRDSRLSLFSEGGLRGSVYLHGWMYVSHSYRTYKNHISEPKERILIKKEIQAKGVLSKQWVSSNATILEE